MEVDEFVQRVFKIALDMKTLHVEERRCGMSICFNSKSNKWLHSGHLRSLFPKIIEPGLTISQLNRIINDVAPGRPCTHVGMREIIKRLQSELKGELEVWSPICYVRFSN